MWTGVMLLGFLAMLGLPVMTGDGDEDSAAGGDADDSGDGSAGDTGLPSPDGSGPGDDPADDPADDPGAEDGGDDDAAAGETYQAGPAPGVSTIAGFQPGSDTLALSISADVSEITLYDASEDQPASIVCVAGEDVTEVVFDGLDEVPVADIWVQIDGVGEPVALAGVLDAAEAAEPALVPDDGGDPTAPDAGGGGEAGLPPDDPEAPTVPVDGGDGDGGTALPPDDPETPTEPGGDGEDDGAALPPDDGTLPTGAPGSSELTELMERDGADPTGQTDPAGDVRHTGVGDDSVSLPDDGIAGTGEGELAFSEAAATTGGAVIDLGDGADTFVAGDEAVHAFGGAGDDQMTAGDGAGALYGGAGDDLLTGEAGAGGTDLLHGGSGDDTIAGGAGSEYLDGGEHGLDPAEGDDVIDGGAGDDTIRGGWGADSLSGGDGDDLIDHRGTDEERIIAEEWHHDWYEDGAADTLDGGAGDDTLVMSSGDVATGGAGADVFWIYPEDSGADPAVITDFEPGEDFLRITLDHGAAGEVALVPSEDGADMLVQIDGQTVAILQGATEAGASDLYVEVKDEIFA